MIRELSGKSHWMANKSKCTASLHTIRNRLLNLTTHRRETVRWHVNPMKVIRRLYYTRSTKLRLKKMVASLEQTEEKSAQTYLGKDQGVEMKIFVHISSLYW